VETLTDLLDLAECLLGLVPTTCRWRESLAEYSAWMIHCGSSYKLYVEPQWIGLVGYGLSPPTSSAARVLRC
jgi:hypothetical protein